MRTNTSAPFSPPCFALSVDDSEDCLLTYASIGHGVRHNDVHFHDQPSHILYHDKASRESPSKIITLLSPDSLPCNTDHATIPRVDPKVQKHRIKYLHNLHPQIHDTSDLPDVRSCDTPSACDRGKAVLTPDQISRFLGCRRLKRFRDIEIIGKNTLVHDSGEPTPTLADFATIPRSPKNKNPIPRSKKFFHKAHCNIGYGDYPGYGGVKYIFTIVNRSTCYVW